MSMNRTKVHSHIGRRGFLTGIGATVAATLVACGQGSTASTVAPTATAKAAQSGTGTSSMVASASAGTPAVPQSAGASATFKLGHSGAQDWQGNLWATTFAKELQTQMPSVKVEIFPNAQLGQDPALAQAVKLGTLDMTVNGPALQQYVPDLAVFDLPFLFTTLDGAHKVQDGEVGAEIRSESAKQGFHFLGWVDIGVRDITNKLKPVNTVADLKGMKIRVPPGKIFLATFQALGASVQSIDFGELYTALQQGVVAGEENPPTTIRVQKYYEVQKYLSLTRHIMSFAYAMMNEDLYQKQPASIRNAIDQAGSAATKAVRDFMITDDQNSLDFLKQQGMQINEPADPDSFRKATESVINSASPSVVALAKKIRGTP